MPRVCRTSWRRLSELDLTQRFKSQYLCYKGNVVKGPEQITYDDDNKNICSVRIVTADPSIAFSVRT